MSNSIYHINKRINSSVEFKGLKAQYIWWLGAGLVVLLILFAILYICKINSFICIGLVFAGGGFLIIYVYRLSNTYGEYGMMKKLAEKNIPTLIISRDRLMFLKPNIKRV